LVALGLPLIAGCGGADKGDTVLATVGDREITASYYKEKLGKLKPEELPIDDEGNVLDTTTEAGRLRFMKALVDKELMVTKALELGYETEPSIANARESILFFESGGYLKRDVVDEPANFISEEEYQHYLTRLGETRHCNFVICNFKDDAYKAIEAAKTVDDWMDVVHEYHAMAVRPNVDYTISVPWGKYVDTFERGIFAVAEGEVTEPIETQHGYWVLKVLEIKSKPVADEESRRGDILASVRQRKANLLMQDFVQEVRDNHKLEINEDALWLVYQGLPEGETILDPETNQPVPLESLKPLTIAPEHLDTILYSYETLEGQTVGTIGDYKSHFDAMSAFQRPKAAESLGSLRGKLLGELDRIVMQDENIVRGYTEDPRVLEAVNKKIEQMIVSALHQDVAEYESHVSPEDIDEYWAEHKEDYFQVEQRAGLTVFCSGRENAESAREAALAGTPWSEMLQRYGTDKENKGRQGKVGPYPTTFINPFKVALFALNQVGDVSEPFQSEGQWAIVRLTEVIPEHQKEKNDVLESIGQTIKLTRQDEKLTATLDEWRNEYPVEIFNDRLNQMPGYYEIQEELRQKRLEYRTTGSNES